SADGNLTNTNERDGQTNETGGNMNDDTTNNNNNIQEDDEEEEETDTFIK
ncbi:unnamed protein product, partial [Rotaria socialis]